MTYLITFLDNNTKSVVHTGEDNNGIYSYLEMLGDPTTLTTSGQRSHRFSPSSSINNDTVSLQTVIAALRIIQKSICECCERIGHKYYACIMCGTKLLPPILRLNMNQFNALHGDEHNEPPIEWSIQSIAYHFKYRTSPSNTTLVVSAIMGRINHHDIDNGDVKVNT